MIDAETFKSGVLSFLNNMSTGEPGVYQNCAGGKDTLYASCFALMIYHYFGELDKFDSSYLKSWGNYILNFQDKNQGYFIGPEISEGNFLSNGHSKTHLCWHSTAHILPVLRILDLMPRYPLHFMEPFLNINFLKQWLEKRDWTKAWIEGNNLLFVGQFLIFLDEDEKNKKAKDSISVLLSWLDNQIDFNTGLWGTNGYCDVFNAVYGAYHQLLLYYYLQHDVISKKNLINAVLSLQHFDGGFSKNWGGGSCEDVDAIDILVNMYKKNNYNYKKIIKALKKASYSVLRRITQEGGFVYKRGKEFMHNGMEYTYAPANKANMFSTWFGVHTLFLISEIIDLPCTRGIEYKFNKSCSMGWHSTGNLKKKPFYDGDSGQIILSKLLSDTYFFAKGMKEKFTILDRAYNVIKRFK